MPTGRQGDQGPTGDKLQGGGQENKNDIANNNNNLKRARKQLHLECSTMQILRKWVTDFFAHSLP